jgi:transposase-like protein
LSSWEVERLLIERGIEVFYETVCRWVLSPQGNAEGKQAAWNDEYMLSLQAG